jgi:hypothetical protein
MKTWFITGTSRLRLFLGESPLRIAVEDYGSRLATWAQWQQVAAAAQDTQG